jgi:DNA polymerase I-like protein with 3'-5' exonuclease and polymerase domains
VSDLVTLDFETYYDSEYSLTKMSTEDYINDPRFDVMLVGVAVGEQEPVWVSGSKKKTADWLAQFNLDRCGVISHNATFDMLILQHVFGIRPGVIFDTMDLAQAMVKPYTGRVSLAKCLEYLECPVQKGTEVQNMLGRPRQSLSRGELERYAAYCLDDVRGTRWLFHKLKPLFPADEFRVMDITHRMYLEPMFELDTKLLAEVLQEEVNRKEALLTSVTSIASLSDLMSNDKFADVLRRFDVEPPMKISPTTGKPTYAFAKNDPEFRQLQEELEGSGVPEMLVAARLGVKTTIAETRARRLLEIGIKYKKLRVPLRYHAAHTGRYGGMEKINMQNPPRVDKSKMRYAMRAPAGHVVLAADLAQIEARIVAWLSKERELLKAFRDGEDVYAQFASVAYRRPVEPRVKTRERFVGKTCILGLGYGMGAEKLKNTLANDMVVIDDKEASRLVTTYREVYPNIRNVWFSLDGALGTMLRGGRAQIGPVALRGNIAILPNDMPIHYRNLHISPAQQQVCYSFGREKRSIWGGKLLENITQALARLIVMENMLAINRNLGLTPVLQVHDELDFIVPEAEAERYSAGIAEIMSTPPAWAEGLPVAVEVNMGKTFGDCK